MVCRMHARWWVEAERFDAIILSGVALRGRLGDVQRAFIGTFWIQAESKPRPVDASL